MQNEFFTEDEEDHPELQVFIEDTPSPGEEEEEMELGSQCSSIDSE